MEYLMLAVTIMFASANNIVLRAHKGKDKQSDSFMFNCIVSAVWIVVLIGIRNVKININAGAIVYALLYGVIQGLFLFFKMQAMTNGPVAVTTLIGNCSLLVSTALGVLIWHEKVGIWQAVGVIILICAMFLCMSGGKKGEKASLKWKLYCVGFFVSAGLVGIVFKAFSKSGCADASDMMITAAIVMTIFCFIVSKIFAAKEGADGLNKTDLCAAAACGILSCVYNRINIYLTGALDSVIFFPVFNGGVILLASLLAFLIFKEKLSSKRKIGIAIGVIAICIIGILK